MCHSFIFFAKKNILPKFREKKNHFFFLRMQLLLFLVCVAAQLDVDVEPRFVSVPVSAYPIPIQPTPAYHLNPTMRWSLPSTEMQPTPAYHLNPTTGWTRPPTIKYHTFPSMPHWTRPPTKTRRPTPQPTTVPRCNYGKPLKDDDNINYYCGPEGENCPIGSNCVFMNGYYSCCQCPRYFWNDVHTELQNP
jgi:hypothetical protein